MAKTFNRRPYSVATPSNSDVKNYFFTNSNWKGLNNDKNFLTVDQETFSDCNNVYMDSEGLLRSRPCLKIKIVTNTGDITLSDILDVWTFGDVTVYKTFASDEYYLVFAPKEGDASQVACNEKVMLYLVERKIFVFEEDGLHYYDVENGSYKSAESFIYIPVVKTFNSGVWNDLESANELTSSYVYRYLYDKVLDEDFEFLIGKNVEVTIDNKSYQILFEDGNEKVFFQEVKSLSDSNFVTIGEYKHALISISETDSYLLSYTEAGELSSTNKYSTYYTTTGLTFAKLKPIDDVIGFPKISKDGNYAICLTADDLYVCSLVDTASDYYEDWTPLIKTKDSNFYAKMLNIFKDCPWGNSTADPIAEMYNIDNFVIYFSERTEQKDFRNRALLICNDGRFKLQPLALLYEKSVKFYDNYQVGPNAEGFELPDVNIFLNHKAYNDNLKIEFRNAVLKGFNVNSTNFFDVTYELTLDINMYLVKNGISTYKLKISKTITFTNFLVPDDDSDIIKWPNAKATLTESGFTFNFSLAPHRGYETFDDFLLSVSLDSPVDIENDYNPLNYMPNAYKLTPNIAYEISKSGFKLLIDANCIYEVDADVGTSGILLQYYDELNCTLQNALHISKGIRRFTKFTESSQTITLYEYGTALSSKELTVDSLSYPLKCIFDNSENLLTNTFMYSGGQRVNFLFEVIPIASYRYTYAHTSNKLYSNNLTKVLIIDEIVQGDMNYILPDFITELTSHYIAKDEKLYISSYPKDGNFKWYLPKISTEVFDDNISNMHAISASEVAVFLNDSVYYIQRQNDSDGDGYDEYFYIKSKLQVGCKKYSDVITSFDGKYVIFPSSRGLVAMTYQELVESSEQVLTFLSDSINSKFSEFNTGNIKLYKYEYWILCYKEGSKDLLCFDIRNNSWWPLTVPFAVDKIITCENEPLFLCNKSLFTVHYLDTEYYDYDGSSMHQIEWLLKSQKLHLEAPNHYKHISNITLTSVVDESGKEPLDLNLTVTNYRKRSNTSDIENFMFNVDTIRVYVKRLNYIKVNEFQYTLQSDEDNAIKIPLSLSSICIKYKLSGQVR